MKNNVNLLFATFCTILMSAISCTKEHAEIIEVNKEKHTCEMKLIGSLVNYDGPETRAEANTTTWADGSVIYLRMNSPLGATTGEAVYNASKDVWTISYYGSLYEGVSNSCTALYLVDKVSYDNSLFTMDEGTAIYEDLEGSYIYEGGDLLVTANLKPKTGRIRFSGVAGTILKVYGITQYINYDIATDIYTTSAAPFKITVGEDGYTPYLYGYFTDTEEPNIKVWIDAKEAYTRFCSKDIFNAGQSGKMTIPSLDSHSGWTDGLYFKVNGAQFKMVAVEGGTFTMGDPNSTSSDYTAHQVTLTGYCIGESEVTKFLFNRIADPEYPIENSDNNKPYATSIRSAKTGSTSQITKLNKLTSVQFSLPTEAQWEFAAKGGVKSCGYIYSGSNNIDDVAWYGENSGSVTHDIKTKKPNELGLYDMSGNVREVVADYYKTFTVSSQVDPLVEYSSAYKYSVLRSGTAWSSQSNNTVVYRMDSNYDSSSDNSGFRLALNWN